MNYNATYSPDDNKLRLYAGGRLSPELYARVKAAGFSWALKQELFVAPMWTPAREDLLIELCGEIGDEDTSLTARAEQRAERFDEYSEKRASDAESARKAVASIADNIPLGQPILIGHHSEKHARKDAERIENGMRRAVKMWETSQYWTQRAAGAIHHAKYKERPDVRARRIKGLEADVRKLDRADKESAATIRLWSLVDQPEKWKPQEDGSQLTREERAAHIAGRVHCNVSRKNEVGYYWTAYDVLRLPTEERYKAAPVMTVDEVIADVRASFARADAYRARWRQHYENRLAYERAMLADAGGTVAQQNGPMKGGAVKCWASPRGGWSYIQKVNKVSVTVLDNWRNGGANFTRTIPFDKLAAVMSPLEVDNARQAGTLIETSDKTGFVLHEGGPVIDGEKFPPGYTPEAARYEKETRGADFEAMRESLKAGVQVVSAPQLFPTPRDLAQRMADLADIRPGHRVLEPSAGTGVLLGAMGGRMFGTEIKYGRVHAVEINGALCPKLRQEFPLTVIHQGDFLAMTPDDFGGSFDRIVMNPPFAGGADIAHILHALKFLAPGGRLVAICAGGPRQADKLRPLVDELDGEWEELPRDTFKESGTSVNTVLLTLTAALESVNEPA